MVESLRPFIQIDLSGFKLHLLLKGRTKLTLHFNSPSRSFYLSVIALVVNEMKKLGKIKFIPLQEHLDLLALLNETVGGAAGSSDKQSLLHRIYTKWKDALPNLEGAPLFRVLGRKRDDGEGAIGKLYSFTDAEKDDWANLFEYMGSHDNVKLKFALDKIGIGLNETSIIFSDSLNGEAWDRFIASLEKGRKEESEPVEKGVISKPPAAPPPPQEKRKVFWLPRYRWILLIVVIGIAAGGMATWKTFSIPARIPIASVDRMKYPLPDDPSIAVLPFMNMTGDPKQDFLCDGMTENIITALAKIPRLFVIARNSTSIYKGKPVESRQVSEELGVRYVLEGSIQRSSERIRVTAQLIDAITGVHLWAERYDRDLQDLFALQDEITLKVLDGVQAKLIWGGDVSERIKSVEKYFRGKQGFDCYLKLGEANAIRLRGSIESVNQARRMIEEAMAMCPENPLSYVFLGWVHHHDYFLGNTKSPRETLDKAIELAQKALAIEETLTSAHVLLCHAYSKKREFARSLAEGERAVALSPGSISALNAHAVSLTYAGRVEEAIPIFQKTIRLSPFSDAYSYRDFGFALRHAGRFEEAVSNFKKAIQIAPDDMVAHLHLAGVYIMLGHEKEARAEAAEVLRINPKFSLENYGKTLFVTKPEAERIIETLRKAGLK